MTTRKEQAAASKDLLIRTARTLISEKGYDAVSIQDIVKACGLSVGAFYHHFKSKNELVNAMDRTPYQEFYDRLCKNTSYTITQQIALYMENWIDISCSVNSLELNRQWFFYHISNPTSSDDPKNKMNIVKQEFSGLLQMAVDHNELSSNTPIEELAHNLTMLLFGSDLYYLMTNCEFDAQTWRKNFCSTALQNLLKPYFSKE